MKKGILILAAGSLLAALACVQRPAERLPSRSVAEDARVRRPDGAPCQTASECASFTCRNGECTTLKTPGGCGAPGKSCGYGGDCCTGNCSGGVCLGSSEICAGIDLYCVASFQCCSGNCDRGFCTGSAQQCARAGQKCRFSGDTAGCCSGNCDTIRGICLGGGPDLAPAGAYCVQSQECESGQCRNSHCR